MEFSRQNLSGFHSYLTNRYQQCLINGFLSRNGKITCCIPQGSILGLLLFLIYINDLPNCLNSTTPCLYADDTQIFTSSRDPAELAYNLNSDLENIMDWLTLNKLQFHSSKSKFMVIGSKPSLKSKAVDLHSSITINNNLVSSVTSQKS